MFTLAEPNIFPTKNNKISLELPRFVTRIILLSMLDFCCLILIFDQVYLRSLKKAMFQELLFSNTVIMIKIAIT